MIHDDWADAFAYIKEMYELLMVSTMRVFDFVYGILVSHVYSV